LYIKPGRREKISRENKDIRLLFRRGRITERILFVRGINATERGGKPQEKFVESTMETAWASPVMRHQRLIEGGGEGRSAAGEKKGVKNNSLPEKSMEEEK